MNILIISVYLVSILSILALISLWVYHNKPTIVLSYKQKYDSLQSVSTNLTETNRKLRIENRDLKKEIQTLKHEVRIRERLLSKGVYA
jgi:cell division protein FtsB